MDNAILVGDTGQATGGRSRLHIGSVLVALVLVVTALVLLQQRADAAQVAQIDVAALIRSIVCPILNSLSAAFANFFGGFILPIINGLKVAFGCTGVSGA